LILGGVCFIAAIACFVWYFWSDFTNYRGDKANDYLRMLKENPDEAVEMVSNDTFFSEDAPELAAADEEAPQHQGAAPPVLPEYQAILAEHSDFAGWITIEGTKVDYPVMLTPTDKDFLSQAQCKRGGGHQRNPVYGCQNESWQSAVPILLFYGHNMKSGAMFGDLKKYLDEDYWQAHKQITF